jgi:hypothetical protein
MAGFSRVVSPRLEVDTSEHSDIVCRRKNDENKMHSTTCDASFNYNTVTS